MTLMPSLRTDEATQPQVASPTCPLCHTVESVVTLEMLQAGDYWSCATCGQVWSARRLETVAAYARFVAAH
jgi:transcription elongation factor Elf1